MIKCKITVLCRAEHKELMEKYENPQTLPCEMRIGDVFYSRGEKPDGLCATAWQAIYPFVFALINGAGNFYDGWLKDPRSAIVSCNDGLRPVSYLVEAYDE
ncbi:MAG: TIGR04076 family protein [Clostridia bacterium]|nr:TIGR04076 family protein [Clostridia bacterium]